MAYPYFTSHPTYVLEYHFLHWGELIYGTKHQLIALGLGINIQFPEEGSRRKVRTIDPRGFKAAIASSSYRGEGVYSASISLPGRETLYETLKWEPFAPGVKMKEWWNSNEFIGTAESLAAAGLVNIANLPGQPGMGKVQVTLSPDGTPDSSTNGHKRRQSGQMRIKRVSNTTYSVEVLISDEESELRREAEKRREAAWVQEMEALPRPAPLTPIDECEVLDKRAAYARKDRQFQQFLLELIK